MAKVGVLSVNVRCTRKRTVSRAHVRNCAVWVLSTSVQQAKSRGELRLLQANAPQANLHTFKEVGMNATARLSAEVILGAVNIADAVKIGRAHV